MNFKLSGILQSGILAQTMFFASAPVTQAQYAPSQIQHPTISALPEKNTRVSDVDKTPGDLLLGAIILGLGSISIWGIKSVKDCIKKNQDGFDEFTKWLDRTALKNKLSKNYKLRETIEKILRERGGIDPKIYN